MTVAQEADDGSAPDFLDGMLLKEEVAPEGMPDIQPATGDGEVNVWVLIELTAVRMQGAEDTDLHALSAGPAKHGAGGGAEERVEQGPVVVEKGPEQVGHGKGNVLPVAVGKDMTLLGYPLLSGFEAAGAALICSSGRKSGNGCSPAMRSRSGERPW